MTFKSDPLKQTKEVICSIKLPSPKHLELYLQGLMVKKVKISKRLGLEKFKRLPYISFNSNFF